MMERLTKKNLCDATIMGEVAIFIELVERDPYLVNIASYACSTNILHVATMHERADIVTEIATRHPQLARNLDSDKSSPLHIAAARGYVPIVAILLGVAPEVCCWRDGQGMNPVHIAAMNGHVIILEKMAEVSCWAAAAREKLDRGQTVLHLCLKHRQIRTFEYLVEKINDLACVEDDDGDMVLHLAVRLEAEEFVRYLLANHKTYELPTNSRGQTVHQIFKESCRDANYSTTTENMISERISYSGQPVNFMGRMSDITMVVVVLIAAMAFQAVVSPAGGVWQDGSTPPHKAGEAVMASTRPEVFKSFIRANGIAFTSSIVTIVLLTTGLPSRNIIFTMAAMLTMWLSMACITISYVASALAIIPNKESESITHVIHVIVAMFLIVYVMFCFSSRATIMSRIMAYWRARKWRQPAAATPTP